MHGKQTQATERLQISTSLSLPLDFVTSTQAILAKKGSGKSYTASVQAEEMLSARQQIVAIDPTGAWWGLRSSADGKSSGFSIAVLGGEHGDLPLEATAGRVIAEAIVHDRFSAILDLRLFRKAEANRFMAAFLETLYHENRDALHVFIDEADAFAPQKPFGDQARTLGATDDLVRRGRNRGLGVTLITQRPAVLNKDVLSQVDMLTTLRMNHPRDLAAIREWVEVHAEIGQAEDMIASLPALPIGEAWCWAPGVDVFERVKIRRRTTFDSGSTPKAGERAAAPRVLAPVDIAQLGKAIAETAEHAKANDPSALRARVVELERRLAERPPAPTVEPRIIERPILAEPELVRIEELATAARVALSTSTEAADRLAAALVDIGAKLRLARDPGPGHRRARRPPEVTPRPPADQNPRRSRPGGTGGAEGGRLRPARPGSGTAEQKILAAASWMEQIGLDEPDVGTVAFLAGYSPRGGAFVAARARLNEEGLLRYPRPGAVALTDLGRSRVPVAGPPPSGPELRAAVIGRLPEAEGRILRVVLEHYPRELSIADIGRATKYKPSGGAFVAARGRLRAMGVVRYPMPGFVQATDVLFPEQQPSRGRTTR